MLFFLKRYYGAVIFLLRLDVRVLTQEPTELLRHRGCAASVTVNAVAAALTSPG